MKRCVFVYCKTSTSDMDYHGLAFTLSSLAAVLAERLDVTIDIIREMVRGGGSGGQLSLSLSDGPGGSDAGQSSSSDGV